MIVNVLVAVKNDVFTQLVLNFQEDVGGNRLAYDLSEQEVSALSHHFMSDWKSGMVSANMCQVLSWYIEDYTLSQDDNRLAIVESLVAKFPDRFYVLGAWCKTGIQYGQELVQAEVLSDEGDVLQPEVIVGNSVYPLHADLLSRMPDDVTYDDIGNELSRTMAVDFKKVNTMGGWKDRRWV